ncbi:nuclease-related domain-containing protein [Rothia amarae]|uniref:nuclease-related domain-containing protein n=1 Tax=Rothia amarae TaxID=169480 RepID=UPI0031D8C148
MEPLLLALVVLLTLTLVGLVFFYMQWKKASASTPQQLESLEQNLALLEGRIHDSNTTLLHQLQNAPSIEQLRVAENQLAERASANQELEAKVLEQTQQIKKLESLDDRAEVQRLTKELASFNRQLSTEQYTRKTILDSCKEAGLHGVLLTNLTFTTSDGVRRQIDHLIITQNTVLVIENKYWSGNIWHLKVPHKGSSPQEALIHHRATPEGPKTNIYFEEHTDSYAVSPGKQARIQAVHLRNYLNTQSPLHSKLFIETLVLFSHANSYYRQSNLRALSQQTIYFSLHNSAQGNSLKDFLLSMTSAKKHKVVNIEELHRALQPLALVNDRF